MMISIAAAHRTRSAARQGAPENGGRPAAAAVAAGACAACAAPCATTCRRSRARSRTRRAATGRTARWPRSSEVFDAYLMHESMSKKAENDLITDIKKLNKSRAEVARFEADHQQVRTRGAVAVCCIRTCGGGAGARRRPPMQRRVAQQRCAQPFACAFWVATALHTVGDF